MLKVEGCDNRYEDQYLITALHVGIKQDRTNLPSDQNEKHSTNLVCESYGLQKVFEKLQNYND